MNIIRTLVLPILLFWGCTGIAQTVEQAETWLQKGTIHAQNGQLDSAEICFQQSLSIRTQLGNTHEMATLNLQLARLTSNSSKNTAALEFYFTGIDLLTTKPASTLKGDLYNGIGSLLLQFDDFEEARGFIEEGLRIRQTVGDSVKMASSFFNLGNLIIQQDSTLADSALAFYQKALAIYITFEQLPFQLITQSSIANVYYQSGDYSKAISKYLSILLPMEEFMPPQQLASIHNNLGSSYRELQQAQQAIEHFHKALTLLDTIESVELRAYLHINLAKAYEDNGDSIKALEWFKSYITMDNQLLDIAKREAISDAEIKYDTLETKYKASQAIVTKNQQLLWLAILIGCLIIVTLLLSLRSYRRKRQHESQVGQLLEEREQLALGSMLRGQESAYKRIGKELHDHVGMLLSTVKLHFDTLEEKLDSNIEQLSSAGEILDKATKAVRGYSHELFSGALQHFGLVEALQELAHDISESEQLRVQLETYQMEDIDLPDSTSHGIYRIIQELLSNTIRHAKAQTATIQLTHRTHDLNIIVSDDGVGFHVDKVATRKGIGLRSVTARIKELGGTYHLDSQRGRGTEVLINIPIPETTKDWLTPHP